MKEFNKSHKLDCVCYDIRGPVMDEAVKMESQGQRIDYNVNARFT